jgi:hypothetical protein
MRLGNWSSRARVGVGALCGALAWGLFAPAPARASCGDYVTMSPQHGSSQTTPSGETSSPQHHSSQQTKPDSPPVPPCPPCQPGGPTDGLPLPCPGPGCSAPSPPESATAPAPVLHPDDWAVSLGTFRLIPSTPVDSLTDPGPGHVARQPSGIFRPPRFAARS